MLLLWDTIIHVFAKLFFQRETSILDTDSVLLFDHVSNINEKRKWCPLLFFGEKYFIQLRELVTELRTVDY